MDIFEQYLLSSFFHQPPMKLIAEIDSQEYQQQFNVSELSLSLFLSFSLSSFSETNCIWFSNRQSWL